MAAEPGHRWCWLGLKNRKSLAQVFVPADALTDCLSLGRAIAVEKELKERSEVSQ